MCSNHYTLDRDILQRKTTLRAVQNLGNESPENAGCLHLPLLKGHIHLNEGEIPAVFPPIQTLHNNWFVLLRYQNMGSFRDKLSLARFFGRPIVVVPFHKIFNDMETNRR